MISVEPIPNSWASLRSTVGAPHSAVDGQKIVFAVRTVKRRGRYGEHVTRLTHGGSLEELEGDVTLYRGKLLREDGTPYSDIISYVPATAANFDTPAMTAGYSIALYVDERVFDQLATLCRMSRMPSVQLDFDLHGEQIRFGGAPDGSEKIWDTKKYPTLEVLGANLIVPLADKVDEAPAEAKDLTVDPERAPATISQIDSRFDQLFKMLIGIQGILRALLWAIIAFALVFLATRIFGR
jgi:hypothetical protein